MKRTSVGDLAFKAAVIIAASAALFLSVVYFYELIKGSALTLGEGWSFLTGSTWDTIRNIYGIYPELWGTVVTSAIALCIGVPVSVGVAVFLSEVSKGYLRSSLSFLVEMLAAVPSVIYGLWGLFVLAPFLSSDIYPSVERYFGFIPIFSCPTSPCFFFGGLSVMTAGVILSIMVIPIIAAIARDAMLAVPGSQREAAYALGATRSETIRMSVLTYARSGIVAAVFLGFARAVGETMAVLMVIGNESVVSKSLFNPGSTIATLIANEFSEASSAVNVSALLEGGLVLLIFSFAASFVGRLIIKRFVTGREAATYA